MKIFEMKSADVDLIKDKLKSDFDDFWNENVLKQEVLSNDTKYIVAKEENEILGFAGIWISPVDVELMNIVVRKDKRCQGIGKKLLEKIIEISKETNLEVLTLEVNEKNIPAKILYEKFGFKVVGIRKKYYKNTDNAILMNIKLN